MMSLTCVTRELLHPVNVVRKQTPLCVAAAGFCTVFLAFSRHSNSVASPHPTSSPNSPISPLIHHFLILIFIQYIRAYPYAFRKATVIPYEHDPTFEFTHRLILDIFFPVTLGRGKGKDEREKVRR